MAPAEAVVFPLPGRGGFPEAPPAALDPVLDAAARCFARHGVSRTSVQDVARELGVNRTTVYRQVGNVDAMARLLLARELHRLLAALPERLEGRSGPDAVVDILEAIVALAREHPVATKVLSDDRELLGPFLVADLPELLDRVTAATAPIAAAAMDAGLLARRDPEVLTQWLSRITLSVIAAPPPGPVRPFLEELLVPALTP